MRSKHRRRQQANIERENKTKDLIKKVLPKGLVLMCGVKKIISKFVNKKTKGK
jgi:hypothetical protein